MSEKPLVALFGKTNAGKSSLFNALLNQPRAIVSDIAGTTTDAVYKTVELQPVGPVVLTDTAGLFDGGALGEARGKKTRRLLETADLGVYVTDASQYDKNEYENIKGMLDKIGLPFLTAFAKKDLCASMQTPQNFFPVSVFDGASVDKLRAAITDSLQKNFAPEPSLIEGLKTDGAVVLVIPVDSGAPAGRLILPQVKFIRDCMDKDVRCHITNEKTLPQALDELPRIAYAVTDSQIFPAADRLVPREIPLVSFSVLTARQKGDFESLCGSAASIGAVKIKGGRVLIAESCTHNRSHEDIGRVKIPMLLERDARAKIEFEFCSGPEFPEDLSPFDLVVHCGGCMISARAFAARQKAADGPGVPFTNYGLAIAYCTGVYERCISSLKKLAE